MRKQWNIKPASEDDVRVIVNELGISAITAQLLINRGIKDPDSIWRFLSCEKSGLYDPFLLNDMKKATVRIWKAIRNTERIAIYGDYDVDGICGVALLTCYLRRKGAEVDFFLPHRIKDGYGLNTDAVQYILKEGFSLTITVDCGITDYEEVSYLQNSGVDVIILDHHRIQPERVPAAYAIINPAHPESEYPFRYLTGVGLAYKVICAMDEDSDRFNEEYLDLVALGTVADVAPMVDENRILVKYGLKRLSTTERVGLKALKQTARLTSKDINTEHIGYILAPRINASGRVSTPELALRLLLSEDQKEALMLAEELEQENRTRQRLQDEVLKEAMEQIERIDFKQNRVLVVWGNNWHPGVVGIVASKIVDRYYRPSVVLSVQGNTVRGSGRSIDTFHLFEAVSFCRDFLNSFGGHRSACGVTLPVKNIEAFRRKINDFASDLLKGCSLVPSLDIDMELPLRSLGSELLEEIKGLEPFGPENPPPIFLSRSLKLRCPPQNCGRGGIKFWVTDERITCEAVYFDNDFGSSLDYFDTVDLVYSPMLRTGFGIESIRLQIKDLSLKRV